MHVEMTTSDGKIVVLDDTITSELKEACPGCGHMACDFFDCPESRNDMSVNEVLNRLKWNAFSDGLESLILALSCAGYDVGDPRFQKAVQTTVQAGMHEWED